MSTLNNSACPSPFLLEREFPATGGYIGGRFCAPSPFVAQESCCLPCPASHWFYRNGFQNVLFASDWIHIASFILLFFILVTYAVLPAKRSQRHYLNVGLVLAVLMIHLGSIVAVGAKPNLCYDKVTPNDMYTSLACAWTGALSLFGAMAAIIWVLFRSAWMHIRVCWDRDPGKRYFWVTITGAVIVPAVFVTSALAATGLSYSIGRTCLTNQNSYATYWGWLIAFSSLAALLQLTATTYCTWIYLQNLMGRNDPMLWRKLRKLLSLQWRSIALSFLVSFDSVFFGSILISQQQKTARINEKQLLTWSSCLVLNGGNQVPCLGDTTPFRVAPGLVATAQYFIAFVGICVFALLIRTSMIKGWLILLHLRTPTPADLEQNPSASRATSHSQSRPSASNIATTTSTTHPSSLTSKIRATIFMKSQSRSPTLGDGRAYSGSSAGERRSGSRSGGEGHVHVKSISSPISSPRSTMQSRTTTASGAGGDGEEAQLRPGRGEEQ
ncbi:MAG: hypothetical protein M1834_007094 [Cirrosporium novae-zelandiae]|nr:MAG: hypothetical protein M1834_007094 [Cirrosporium novae-zelandiae]